jgi:hypothetical protein
MTQYFETGEGAHRFGPQQNIAVEASKRLEDQIADLARLGMKDGDISGALKFVQAWADEHPLDNPLFVRESVAAHYGAGAVDSQLQSGLSAVNSMEEIMGDLEARLKLYAALLPRQIRWETEVAFENTVGVESMARFLSDVDTMRVSLTDIEAFFDGLPDLVSEGGGALLASLEGTGAAMLQAVNEQGTSSMAELKREGERLARAAREERIATLTQVEVISQALLAQGQEDMRETIDHVFLRTAQLLGGLLLATIVSLVGVLSWFRRNWSVTRRPRDPVS